MQIINIIEYRNELILLWNQTQKFWERESFSHKSLYYKFPNNNNSKESHHPKANKWFACSIYFCSSFPYDNSSKLMQKRETYAAHILKLIVYKNIISFHFLFTLKINNYKTNIEIERTHIYIFLSQDSSSKYNAKTQRRRRRKPHKKYSYLSGTKAN